MVLDCTVTPSAELDDYDENDPSATFNCNEDNQSLWGPSELRCNASKGGWITKGGRTAPFPQCLGA